MASALVSGVFALLRAQFPHDSVRQLITRALWNVHNGLGGGVFAKRIDDSHGYGQPLPCFAHTEAPPTGAANPISGAFEAAFTSAAPGAAFGDAGRLGVTRPAPHRP